MAKPTAAATINQQISKFKNFLNFTKSYLKRNNPVKNFVNGTVAYFKDLTTVKKKLRNIERRIIYEKYKLKKTELILAQNSEHVFLKGRSLNQQR